METPSGTLVLLLFHAVAVAGTHATSVAASELWPLAVSLKNLTYWLSNVTADHSQASNSCLRAGGSLALFSSNDEYETVLDFLDKKSSAKGKTVRDVWIDVICTDVANQSAARPEWEYENVNASFWTLGHPASDRPDVVDTCCVQVLNTEQVWGSLEDKDCNTSSRFLCEFPRACLGSNVSCEHLCTDNDQREYECLCHSGYILGDNGFSCEDVDECLSHPCEQICNNMAGSYVCGCQTGYRLTNNKHSCTGVTTGCAKSKGVCEQICVEENGSHHCSCHNGYSLARDNHSCTDVDECDVLQPCHQICVNVAGSFRCQCLAGYMLSATTCLDIDECGTPTACEQKCTNTAGSYKCSCYEGYTLAGDNRSCSDVNECQMNQTICSQICTNTNGSFQCSCSTGFTLGADLRSCNLEVSMCSILLLQCQHTCTTSPMSCSCYVGYTLTADGTTCVDVNECLSDNGDCQQTCVNQLGSYKCGCADGYHLAADRRACLSMDESIAPACQQKHLGVNGNSSCDCFEGYTLNDDGISCSDLDECSTPGVCQHACANTVGSYTCGCQEGYHLVLDGDSCEESDDSGSDSEVCTYRCVQIVANNTQGCPHGYTLANNTCLDINECLNSSNACQQVCINTDGSFTCGCKDGHILTTNQSCVELTLSIESTNQCPCPCVRPTRQNLSCPDNVSCTMADGLLLDKRDTSRFRRTTFSVPDNRLVSATMGVSAMLLASVPLGLIIVSDIIQLKCLFFRDHGLPLSLRPATEFTACH